MIKKVNISASETERKLNGDYPVVSVVPSDHPLILLSTYPHIREKYLPSDVKYNPDDYILPLDIVIRPLKGGQFEHYGIYLGNS